jgi:hypothetical protein
MHVHLHASLMKETNNICDDPLAKFFNKKAADKCYLQNMRKETSWVEKNLDKIVADMNDRADDTNKRVLGLTEKYNTRNGNNEIDVANNLYVKNKILVDLSSATTNIKNQYAENEQGITTLYNDYSSVAQNSIATLRDLADKISIKLSTNVYTKNFKNKRNEYLKTYDRIGNQLKQMVKTGMVNPGDEILPTLTYLQKHGKK